MDQLKTRFWTQVFTKNATVSIFHQWEQLEATGCIQNFRIAAGEAEGFREGYFFADSDAYKWLEAASLLLGHHADAHLKQLVDNFVDILEKAQIEDGYLFTYNQVHFQGVRWKNLQVEHEFYCLGHLIEAGVAHHQATGETRLLSIARRAADLLVEEFLHAPPPFTDGHEEIEIALLRLSRHTERSVYSDLARHFLQVRGRVRGYAFLAIKQSLSMIGRMRTVGALRSAYISTHPQYHPVTLPAHNQHVTPRMTPIRFLGSLLSGKYAQQHAPLEKQDEPVGHAVRFSYLQTATAMALQEAPDPIEIGRLEQIWEQMTTRRMYVTGGIGSLPLIEGFGRDYELNPEVAYAETCAALGNILWNHEMSILTGMARYADLLEWQLYNAALVGVSLDGCSYFYNNPLVSKSTHQRASWYDIPCCPSNLSRIIASLDKLAVRVEPQGLILDQYIPGDYSIGNGAHANLTSSFPWEGKVSLKFSLETPQRIGLRIRVPAWTDHYTVLVNGNEIISSDVDVYEDRLNSAVGLHFDESLYWRTERVFNDGDHLDILFSMPLRFRPQDPRLPNCGGKVALTRGPLVYCLESVDNPVDLFNITVDPGSLSTSFDETLLEGVQVITGRDTKGNNLKWIPYLYWGNRGAGPMTMFFDLAK